MATEEKEPVEEKKPKSKLPLIIGIVVVVLILGGVGAFFALKGGATEEDGEEVAADEEEVTEEAGEHGDLPGAILPLETFIVNLQVKGSFLKAGISLQFAEPELPAHAEEEMPKIKDSIIRVLSRKSHQEILSVEGKEKLKDEIRMTVNQALNTEDVVGVYFTEFIVQ